MIGLGRPMCVDTDICKRLLAGETEVAASYESGLPLDAKQIAVDATEAEAKALEVWSQLVWFFVQLWRIGEGQEPKPELSALDAYRIYCETEQRQTEKLAALESPLD